MIDGIYEFIAEKTDNDFFEFNDLLDFLGNRGLIDKNDEQTKRTIRGFLDELRRQKFLSSEEDCDFFHIIVLKTATGGFFRSYFFIAVFGFRMSSIIPYFFASSDVIK